MSTTTRKRGAVACDNCRRRKRRCDGKIPCSLCRDVGTACQYPELPTATDEDRLPNGISTAYEERLARVEASLDQHGLVLFDVQRQLSQIQTQSAFSAGAQSSTSPQSQIFQNTNGATPREVDDIDNVHFLIPEKHCTPTTWLLSHTTLRGLLGDYPERYLHALEKKNEVAADFSSGGVSQVSAMDIGDQSALVDWYFSTSHGHYPIFTREELARLIVDSGQHCTNTLSNAVILLVCALGCICGSEGATGHDDHQKGKRFSSQAIRIVNDHFCFSVVPSVALCRALVLVASYLAHVGRPLHSWRYAQLAFSTFQQIQARLDDGLDSSDSDALLRTYWSCFVLECDRTAELDLPRSGIEAMADDVPLPSGHGDHDHTTIAFLAEISIRRLLNRIHNSLYPNSNGVQRVKVPQLQKIAQELERQLTGWYESIPPSVRPPLGTEPCENDRARILRIRYYAAMHILHRPFLLSIADHPDIDFLGTSTMASAETCINACKTYLLNSTEMIGKRTPYLWTFSASSLGALFVLSIARSVPSLRPMVSDLAQLQTLYLDKVRPWASVGSSLEAMVSMVETIMAKERFQ